jgi:hypothetical protein
MSVLTNAAASRPPAQHLGAQSRANIKGNTNVSGTLHVKGNINVKKNSYFRGKAEIDKGLLVKNGLKVDSLAVSGAFSADSGTIANSLQVSKGLSADSITTTTLGVQGLLTASGGIDAKGSSITTTGSLAAGQATVSSLTDTGSLTAGSATLGGLTVTGAVDFTHATVTGLSGVGNATSLTVGAVGATSPPLTIVENGQSSTIGVNNGSLVLGGSAAPNVSVPGNLSVGGNLSVTGTSNLSVSSLTAPNASGTTTPGQFTITGNPIVLTGAVQTSSSLTVGGATTHNGNVTVSSGNDLILPGTAASGTTAANAAHIVASANRDIAGTVTVTIPANTPTATEVTANVSFTRNYAGAPVVVVTPAQDPSLGATAAAKYWVTPTGSGPYTGFTLHYVTTEAPSANAQTVTFYYHVIGG